MNNLINLLPHASRKLADQIEAYLEVYQPYLGRYERNDLHRALGHLRGTALRPTDDAA